MNIELRAQPIAIGAVRAVLQRPSATHGSNFSFKTRAQSCMMGTVAIPAQETNDV
jgi:hypothetical protein